MRGRAICSIARASAARRSDIVRLCDAGAQRGRRFPGRSSTRHDDPELPAFDQSPIYDPTSAQLPGDAAGGDTAGGKTGAAMGVAVKPAGPRGCSRWSTGSSTGCAPAALETNRVANWWADRMVATDQPLREKMALFWHGHFATGDDKVRDYRKMLVQLDLFQRQGTGNFRDLLVGVAQDPAMLVFLDAGRNVKGAPNENFAREIMELFTMGVGNYTEKDIREAARAFTGWIDDDLDFGVDAGQARRRREDVSRQDRPF